MSKLEQWRRDNKHEEELFLLFATTAYTAKTIKKNRRWCELRDLKDLKTRSVATFLLYRTCGLASCTSYNHHVHRQPKRPDGSIEFRKLFNKKSKSGACKPGVSNRFHKGPSAGVPKPFHGGPSVKVMRCLNHPNVLRFIGLLYKDNRLNFLSEFVHGGTLRETIKKMDSYFSWRLRVSFAKDIAAGMAYLHSMNVIHRDLNSDNCLVRENQSVVVADFGLARLVMEEKTQGRLSSVVKPLAGPSQNPKPGLEAARSVPEKVTDLRRLDRRKRYTVVGNPYWMAPEMIHGKIYDERVDVFSFGIMLCEVIGRVSADPDYLPRTSDFGLNIPGFLERYHCPKPPPAFMPLAALCCDLESDTRPSFVKLEEWLSNLLMHLDIGLPLHTELDQFQLAFWNKHGQESHLNHSQAFNENHNPSKTQNHKYDHNHSLDNDRCKQNQTNSHNQDTGHDHTQPQNHVFDHNQDLINHKHGEPVPQNSSDIQLNLPLDSSHNHFEPKSHSDSSQIQRKAVSHLNLSTVPAQDHRIRKICKMEWDRTTEDTFL